MTIVLEGRTYTHRLTESGHPYTSGEYYLRAVVEDAGLGHGDGCALVSDGKTTAALCRFEPGIERAIYLRPDEYERLPLPQAGEPASPGMEGRGLVKLLEEMGELAQIAAKVLAYPDLTKPHPDGQMLSTRLIEEIGDVEAAISFVIVKLGLDQDEINFRQNRKERLFQEWDSPNGNYAFPAGQTVELIRDQHGLGIPLRAGTRGTVCTHDAKRIEVFFRKFGSFMIFPSELRRV